MTWRDLAIGSYALAVALGCAAKTSASGEATPTDERQARHEAAAPTTPAPARAELATELPADARLVTVGGAITETVFALGRGERVIGRDSTSSYPAAAAALTDLGYQRTLAAETVLALRPDVVLASHEAGPPAALAQLRAAGVRVERLPEARDPTSAAARLRALGALLGQRQRAEELAARVEQVAPIARAARPRVLFLYARGGGVAMVAGADSPAATMIELAGGQPATPGFAGYRALSGEAVLAAAPDVVLVPARSMQALGGQAGLWALPGLAATPAGRARRVAVLDDLLLLGFGPRLPEAVEALALALEGRDAASAPP